MDHNSISELHLLVFRRKDLCEAKPNVECSKNAQKLCFTLKQKGGGVRVNRSVLNMF